MINKIYQEVEKLKNKKDFIDLTDSNFARPEFFKPVYKIISPSIQKLLKSRESEKSPLFQADFMLWIATKIGTD